MKKVKDVENIQKDKAVEEEVFNYSLGAFFGTFLYYIMVGDWRLSIVSFLTAVLIPLRSYLFLGLVLGFFAGKGWNVKIKWSPLRLIIACLSVILFCTLKIVRFHYLGAM